MKILKQVFILDFLFSWLQSYGKIVCHTIAQISYMAYHIYGILG